MKMNGFSIGIEGIDGSGKRTLAEFIENKFKAEVNDNVEIISFPRHQEEFSGALVDKFLYEGLKFNDNKAIREGMLYAIDRMVSLSRVRDNGKSKIDELREGKFLIFDRYLSSNFIHRCNNFTEDELVDYIYLLEYIEFEIIEIPKPNMTFVLSVKPEISYENILKRGRQMDENESLEKLTESYNNLDRLCKLQGYTLIDCCVKDVNGKYKMKSREEIGEEVWSHIEKNFIFERNYIKYIAESKSGAPIEILK